MLRSIEYQLKQIVDHLHNVSLCHKANCGGERREALIERLPDVTDAILVYITRNLVGERWRNWDEGHFYDFGENPTVISRCCHDAFFCSLGLRRFQSAVPNCKERLDCFHHVPSSIFRRPHRVHQGHPRRRQL